MLQVVSDGDVRARLHPRRAHAVVREAFVDLARGAARDEPRHRTVLGQGSFNVMWASSDTLDAIALKAYPVVRADVRQAAAIHILLYTKSTGELRTMVRGDALGQLRTGAASVLAAELLAPPAPTTLALIGTGFQARGQLRAFLDHFPSLREVSIAGRTAAGVDALVAAATEEYAGREVTVRASAAEHAVRSSTLVVTATSSTEPVLHGDWLRPGTHLTCVGSNHPRAREIDARTLHRCSAVVVDSRASAEHEAGDLVMNGFEPAAAAELAEVIMAPPSRDPEAITLFTSQGMAVQDLYTAVAVVDDLSEEIGRPGRRAEAPPPTSSPETTPLTKGSTR